MDGTTTPPEGRMRDEKLLIRLSDTEKTLLDQYAQRQGAMTATWARMMLLRSVREPAPPTQYALYTPTADRPTLLSLFCGAGGLDQGFREAGFRTAVAVDIDNDCVKTFAYNHPHAKVLKRDIRAVTLRELDRLAERRIDPMGVLGGPPCQSFSVSNVHQSNDDPRHRLPEAYASLLRRLNKRKAISFFVFENVPGLLGRKHIHRYNRFKKLFEKAGFAVFEQPLDAKDYGIPQERPRIFIVGINQHLHRGVSWTPPSPESRTITVADAIRDLPEPVYNARGLDPDAFAVHPNHWVLVPRSKKFSNGVMKEGEMWGRSFRTLRWDKPSWTVAYGHREVHVHPNGKRRLSIYEAMLLQSFPQNYRLLGNMTAQVSLVSDAVPPRLALRVAQSIRESLRI